MALNVLVTGATGTVGRALVHRLLADGHRVRALTRDPARAVLPDDFAPLATGDEVADLCLRNGVRRVTVLGGDVGMGPFERAVAAGDRLAWTRLAPVEFMANKREWAPSVAAGGTVSAAFADVPAPWCTRPISPTWRRPCSPLTGTGAGSTRSPGPRR